MDTNRTFKIMRARLMSFWSVLTIGCAAASACDNGGRPPQANVLTARLCRGCNMVFRPYLQLGSVDGWDLFSQSAAFGIHAERWIMIADAKSYPGQVLLYDATTKERPLVIGQLGSGPGEFRYVSAAWMQDDRLHVYDGLLQRESVFDTLGSLLYAHPYAYGRIPRIGGRVPLPDGGLILSATIQSKDAAGYPVHVLDRNRKLLRSFGADTAMLLPGFFDLNARVIAKAADGALWVARTNEYRIEKWSITGNHLNTFRREVTWFKPWLHWDESDFTVAEPPPTLAWINEDPTTGLLWIIVRVPDKGYRPTRHKDDPEGPVDMNTLHKYFDWLVEVVDTRTQTVVASERFDRAIRPIGGRIIVSQHEVDGTPRFVFSQMLLTGMKAD